MIVAGSRICQWVEIPGNVGVQTNSLTGPSAKAAASDFDTRQPDTRLVTGAYLQMQRPLDFVNALFRLPDAWRVTCTIE